MSSPGRNNSSAVEELVHWILRRWSNHKKDAAQIVMYLHDIGELVEECGVARVQAAARAARTNCSFLPEPAELRKLLPSPEIHSQPQLHDPNCRDCGGSGWKPVSIVESSTGRPERRVTRCKCKPPVTPEPAPRANPEQYRAFIKEALKSVNAIDPPPNRDRRMEIKTRMARMQAEKPASQEVGELIPGAVLTREQMDARRATEHAEIAQAAEDFPVTSPNRETVQ